MLPADPDLAIRTARSALVHGRPHQAPHPVDVEGLEGGDTEHAALEVGGEERALDVVAGETPGGLREVPHELIGFASGNREFCLDEAVRAVHR